MGYQRSSHTSTVATLDIIPSSNGTSSTTAQTQTGNHIDADKENTELPMLNNTSSKRRYPCRSKIAVKDKSILGENGGSRSKSAKNPRGGKRPKCPSSNPGEDAAVRKRTCLQISDGCFENHNVKITQHSIPADGNGQDDGRNDELISKIQEIYSKLHSKYRRLKELKFGEVEKYVEEQNRNLTAYVQAQQELLEHIRMENNLLKLHADQPNITMTLNRLKLLEQENKQRQSDLFDQHTKNIELKNEVRRLESLLSDHTDARNKTQNFPAVLQNSEAHCLDTEGHVFISQDIHSKNQGDTLVPYHTGLELNLKHQCSTAQKESLQHSSQACGCNTRVDIGNQERRLVSGETIEATDKNIQPDMKDGLVKSSGCDHVQKDASEGEATSMAVGTVNSLVKLLLQHIVGFKITVADAGESAKLLFLHKSSGYSFQLKYLNRDSYLSKYGELAYEVISFGTLRKVIPDWMKEEIIFNLAQVDVFFDRLSHVVKGRGCH